MRRRDGAKSEWYRVGGTYRPCQPDRPHGPPARGRRARRRLPVVSSHPAAPVAARIPARAVTFLAWVPAVRRRPRRTCRRSRYRARQAGSARAQMSMREKTLFPPSVLHPRNTPAPAPRHTTLSRPERRPSASQPRGVVMRTVHSSGSQHRLRASAQSTPAPRAAVRAFRSGHDEQRRMREAFFRTQVRPGSLPPPRQRGLAAPARRP
jgi:hypothetical protein